MSAAANTAKNEVGGEILSYCTSCKMDLNHTIVAMTGDRVVKAECKTCKKTHAYRAPKGAKEPRKRKTAASAEAAARTSVEEEWKKLMAAKKDAPAKTYSASEAFQLGDKIRHPVFGEGIVDKLIYPNKVEVIFQNDLKTLVSRGS